MSWLRHTQNNGLDVVIILSISTLSVDLGQRMRSLR